MQLPHHDSSWSESVYNEKQVLERIRHYLPAQAPLNEFIHHNTLHSFQEFPFEVALNQAQTIFGYHVHPLLSTYRKKFENGQIKESTLRQVIARLHGAEVSDFWFSQCLQAEFRQPNTPRIGQFRGHWKNDYAMDLDARVHPLLFRTLSNFLDQGIAAQRHPFAHCTLRQSIKGLNDFSYFPFFKSKRVQQLLSNDQTTIGDLLKIIVGDERYNAHYLFDMCFAHAGWSGMVATIESQPATLIDRRKISLADAIFIELLMEIDALDKAFGSIWAPLSAHFHPKHLFDRVPFGRDQEVLQIWQEAFEWSFYNSVIQAIQKAPPIKNKQVYAAQAVLCIDDRECSFRRYLEVGPHSFETFGTPGFFGAAFYFQSLKGHHKIKSCPAPVNPLHLIKEIGAVTDRKKEHHFSKTAFHPMLSWLMSPVLGLIAAYHLIRQLIWPSRSANTTYAQHHHQSQSSLHIDYDPTNPEQDGLRLGYTSEEMADIVYSLCRSIGLVQDFSPIIYVIGHGSSSTNNPHYAAYDCGACSGRAGSVNARVVAYMANKKVVRELLEKRGLSIPASTIFIGCLHDTSRDEMTYYDDELEQTMKILHHQNMSHISQALAQNALERARRFEHVDTQQPTSKVHSAMKLKTVSLFEPRPELNHATNAACLVGRRKLSQSVFLDRRSFLNSYDPTLDPDGDLLFGILRAVAPVCGGINLEYYFSHLDNHKLGAGSKLPHNVVGLIGVSNGIEGDLRTGLPSQMIEIHDPLRLLIIVEQEPEIILSAIIRDSSTYNWFQYCWVRLISIHPNDHSTLLFNGEKFEPCILPNEDISMENKKPHSKWTEGKNLPIQILKQL